MNVFSRTTLATALLVSAVAAPASAQAWKFDFGVNGGYSFYTKMLDGEDTGLPDTTPFHTAKFDKGWILGSQLTFWPSARLGIRANGRYSDRGITGADMDGTDVVTSVNLWGTTGDLLLRLKAPAAEYTGMEMLPYLALGLGFKFHNPGFDSFTCIDTQESKSFACAPFTTGLPSPTARRTFALGEHKVIAGHVGLGADWRLGRTFAVRTEISDQIFNPKIYLATRTGTTNNYNLPNGDESIANLTHEFGAQIGLHMLFGVPRAMAVAVVEPTPMAPAPVQPTPTPTPTPAPPAPPREDAITVCVIDPTVPGGIRMQNAIFIPSRGDTLVMLNGQRTALRSSIGNVMVASSADWYVRGQPLSITVGNEKMEFVTYGTRQNVEASNLGFLGTINGVPVYADRDEIKDVIDELNDLNRAQRGGDLAKMLGEHKDLREAIAKVKILYVPLQTTGCWFQAVQQMEQVRKNRDQ